MSQVEVRLFKNVCSQFALSKKISCCSHLIHKHESCLYMDTREADFQTFNLTVLSTTIPSTAMTRNIGCKPITTAH